METIITAIKIMLLICIKSLWNSPEASKQASLYFIKACFKQTTEFLFGYFYSLYSMMRMNYHHEYHPAKRGSF